MIRRLALLVGLFAATGAAGPVRADDWSGEFGATTLNGAVNCAVKYRDKLYVGGEFTTANAGNDAISHVAVWEGGRWTHVGYGLSAGVTDLVVYRELLVAAGRFVDSADPIYHPSLDHVGVFVAGIWQDWFSGFSGQVTDLEVSGDTLFAAGKLDLGLSHPVSVASWNGQGWSQFGPAIPGLQNGARRILHFRGRLYVLGDGGLFGIDLAHNSLTSPLAGSADVVAAVVWDDQLIVAGRNLLGTQAGTEVASWDGTSWTLLGATRGTVAGLGLVDGDLVIAGVFSEFSGTPVSNLVRLSASGGAPQPVAEALPGRIIGLQQIEGSLFATGARTTMDAGEYALVADWTPAGWRWWSGGQELNAPAYAMIGHGGGLVAGGAFTRAGRDSIRHVGVYRRGHWSRLGGGVNDYVWALLSRGDTLVAGGAFDQADGAPVAHVAVWDGSRWQGLGAGFDGNVYALSTHAGQLYAGGAFTHSGGTPLAHMARWDGTAWQPVGAGTDGWVTALGEFQGKLIAGGFFNRAGDQEASKLAAWDGAAWAGLGADFPENASVRTVAGFRDELYVGGRFPGAGGVVSANLARFDGVAWHAVPAGLYGECYALLNARDRLFIGSEGGSAVGRLAGWDGQNINALVCGGLGGDGGSYVTSIAEFDDALYCSGEFLVALRCDGTARLPSLDIARWGGFSSLVPVTIAHLGISRGARGAVIGWDVVEQSDRLSGVRLERGSDVEERHSVPSVWSRHGTHCEVVDAAPPVGAARYWLQLIERGGGVDGIGPVDLPAATPPARLSGLDVAPNPSSGVTRIEFSLGRPGRVRGRVFDSSGQLVRTVADLEAPAGPTRITWDGASDRGRPSPAGIYFVRIEVEGELRVARVVRVP